MCRGGVGVSDMDTGRRFVLLFMLSRDLFLGLPRLLFGGLTLCREWDKKVNVRWGWGFPSWSHFATYSFNSIHQSSLKIVSWRNGLIEYLNFELTVALIFPQVSCVLELLTFRLCQLIKMFLCSYWGLIFFFFFSFQLIAKSASDLRGRLGTLPNESLKPEEHLLFIIPLLFGYNQKANYFSPLMKRLHFFPRHFT